MFLTFTGAKMDMINKLKSCIQKKKFKYEGVKVVFDSIKKKDPSGKQVMGIFYEEQIITWENYKDEINNINDRLIAKVDFLEVGCGNGIWSILFSKFLGGNIIAIDKNPNAILYSKINARKNGVEINLKNEEYNTESAPEKGVKVIYLNPPFHIYPEELENKVPLFARGGFDGQSEFKNQLKIANNHLVDGGIIIFIMMCLGNENVPEYVKYIPKIMDNISLEYQNIFEPIKTEYFLKRIYGNKYMNFQNYISKNYNQLFYTHGIIKKDGKKEIINTDKKLDLRKKEWENRIKLHKNINKFLFEDEKI
jgi:SAM-dependent methyltransferase